MPARLRFCSTGSSLPSIVIPGSSSRTASTSTGSSASSPARGGALLAGTVGTFDTLFAFLAGGRPPVARTLGDAERTLVLRHLIAAAPPGSLGPSARFAGFADSLAGALTEIEASLLDPEDLGPGLAELTRAYRAELERLSVRDPRHGSPAGRRAADERARVVERRPGLRVRLRGPDGSGVAPDRGARGAR